MEDLTKEERILFKILDLLNEIYGEDGMKKIRSIIQEKHKQYSDEEINIRIQSMKEEEKERFMKDLGTIIGRLLVPYAWEATDVPMC